MKNHLLEEVEIKTLKVLKGYLYILRNQLLIMSTITGESKMTNNETRTAGTDVSNLKSRYRTMTVKTIAGDEIEIQLYGR